MKNPISKSKKFGIATAAALALSSAEGCMPLPDVSQPQAPIAYGPNQSPVYPRGYLPQQPYYNQAPTPEPPDPVQQTAGSCYQGPKLQDGQVDTGFPFRDALATLQATAILSNNLKTGAMKVGGNPAVPGLPTGIDVQLLVKLMDDEARPIVVAGAGKPVPALGQGALVRDPASCQLVPVTDTDKLLVHYNTAAGGAHPHNNHHPQLEARPILKLLAFANNHYKENPFDGTKDPIIERGVAALMRGGTYTAQTDTGQPGIFFIRSIPGVEIFTKLRPVSQNNGPNRFAGPDDKKEFAQQSRSQAPRL